MRRAHVSTILIAFLLIVPRFAFGACDLNATTSNFASQLSAAQPGQTVCLATGNYGNFAGVTKTSPGVTITAASGATPTMTLQIRQTSPVAQWLIFDTITINGGIITGPANNLTFQNSHFTSELDIWPNASNNACSGCSAMNNNAILFNNDLFDEAADPNATGPYGGSVVFLNSGNSDPSPAGVTIENSKFTSGCDDGVDIFNAGRGVTIGPGNEFYNLQQGSCSNHVDAIQFDGSDSPGPTITGNYFHNNSTGITDYDNSNNAVVTNNVITTTTQDSMEIAGFDSASVVQHNTIIGGTINCDRTHEGNICQAQIKDNIADGITLTTSGGTGSPSYLDYNLCTGGTCAGSGTHNLSGMPTYVGGSNPTTYAGFALTGTSLGYNAASDGKNIGMNTSTTTGGPSAPTGLTALVQ